VAALEVFLVMHVNINEFCKARQNGDTFWQNDDNFGKMNTESQICSATTEY
jgi:hypothetical protein